MTDQDEAAAVLPLTVAWVNRHLEVGERIVRTEVLHGGITADVRKLTVGRHDESTRDGSPRDGSPRDGSPRDGSPRDGSTRDGSTRHGSTRDASTRDASTRDLVLRSYVDPFYLGYAEDLLTRESGALSLLPGTGVPAPALVAVDPTAEHCEYPSLLMTHLPGRTVLDDEGLATRVPLLARQLVAIHALRPAERPRKYVTLTTADTVVTPQGADAATWAAAIDVIRSPAPRYQGRFLHRDFQPGNVLFDAEGSQQVRITGVVDWAGTSWGPADLDVAHTSTNLALLHGPTWGLAFAAAYEEAGGVLAEAKSERLYWLVRDALAFSEELEFVARPWRKAGRTDLTTRAVEERLDAYVTTLMG